MLQVCVPCNRSNAIRALVDILVDTNVQITFRLEYLHSSSPKHVCLDAYCSTRAYCRNLPLFNTKGNLGHFAFVRQLREVDKHGAPLLFHAAKSDGMQCLNVVIHLLENLLGREGFNKQLHAIDNGKRSILMFAVRSPNFEVYKRIVQELQDSKNDPVLPWSILFDQRDKIGRNVLHYAAEGNCPDILKDLVRQAEEKGKFEDLVSGTDAKGTTPIMCVLRDSYRTRKSTLTSESNPTSEVKLSRSTSEEKHRNWRGKTRQRAGQREKKLDILMDKMEPSKLLKHITLPHQVAGTAACESTNSNRTALMHAARGGLSAYNLAVDRIQRLRRISRCNISRLPVLAMGTESPDERNCRIGMLVEEAAIGGDLDVMEYVVDKIGPSEVCSVVRFAEPKSP